MAMTSFRLVVCDGDETGQELLDEALRVLDPAVIGIELELERFDLSLANRRRTHNAVVHEAAEAMRAAGVPVGDGGGAEPDVLPRCRQGATGLWSLSGPFLLAALSKLEIVHQLSKVDVECLRRPSHQVEARVALSGFQRCDVRCRCS